MSLQRKQVKSKTIFCFSFYYDVRYKEPEKFIVVTIPKKVAEFLLSHLLYDGLPAGSVFCELITRSLLFQYLL